MNSNHIRNLNKHSSEEDMLSCIIGCTPIKLEEAHLAEIRSLIDQYPTDLQKPASDEVFFIFFLKLSFNVIISEESRTFPKAA